MTIFSDSFFVVCTVKFVYYFEDALVLPQMYSEECIDRCSRLAVQMPYRICKIFLLMINFPFIYFAFYSILTFQENPANKRS